MKKRHARIVYNQIFRLLFFVFFPSFFHPTPYRRSSIRGNFLPSPCHRAAGLDLICHIFRLAGTRRRCLHRVVRVTEYGGTAQLQRRRDHHRDLEINKWTTTSSTRSDLVSDWRSTRVFGSDLSRCLDLVD
jgi:hypothetical protein